jgi:hypothetical protein
MNLAYKVHMDLISDAIEISHMRADYFRSKAPAYIGSDQYGDSEAKLASRLNAGYFEVQGANLRQVGYSGDGGQAFHLKADSDSGRSRTAFR